MRATHGQDAETKAAVEKVDQVLEACDRRKIDPLQLLEAAVEAYDKDHDDN